MDQATIEVLNCVVMAVMAGAAYLIRRDLLPLIQSKMTAQQLKTARDMADVFVYMAQQAFSDKSGVERKKIVRDALKGALQKSGISLSDQFVDDMIEAAVKGLRIMESCSSADKETEAAVDGKGGKTFDV